MLTSVGMAVIVFLGLAGSVPLFGLGVCLALGGVGLLGAGCCRAWQKRLVPEVPGHFLLHPRTGTRFSPQQGLAIQRRLDRIRREMSSDSVGRESEPEPPLPSTPPPWTMEPPPSYDTVMKSQEHQEQSQNQSHELNEQTECRTVAEDSNQC
uniref:Barttin n=1 Tax=Knipowitschia caucasica TaxID=637954 RepID=A0AAV2KSG9_KNICA